MPLARSFVQASSQYLEVGTPAVTAFPVTMSVWFNQTPGTTGAMVAISTNDGVGIFDQLGLYCDLTALKVSMFIASGGGTWEVWSTTTYRERNWHHACGIAASDTYRAVYLDGGGKETGTGARPFPRSPSATTISSRNTNSGRTFYHNGGLAHAAIWNAALTDAEVQLLARGRRSDGRHILPPDIRPGNLVGYWPLDGIDRDLSRLAAYNMTATNAPGWTGGPTQLAGTARRGVYMPVAAAGGLSIPVAMHHYTKNIKAG